MFTLYQTDDMEFAIRRMLQRNHKVVLLKKTYNRKSIELRPHRIPNFKYTLMRENNPYDLPGLIRWQSEGGLLNYRPGMTRLNRQNSPAAEGLFVVEAPTDLIVYYSITEKISREVVIYRPPTWELHMDTMAIKHPGSREMVALVGVMQGLCGLDLNPLQQMAVDYAKFDRSEVSVFTADQINELTGIDKVAFRHLLKFKFRGFHVRYDVFMPNIRPSDPEHAIVFDALLQEPDLGGGIRMFRFGFGSTGINTVGFIRILKALIYTRHIRKLAPIHIMKQGYKFPNLAMLDAQANVRYGEFYKIKNMIDAAPVYPL